MKEVIQNIGPEKNGFSRERKMKITLANGEQSASTDCLIKINKRIKINKYKKQFK